jgi:hypothetical protein
MSDKSPLYVSLPDSQPCSRRFVMQQPLLPMHTHTHTHIYTHIHTHQVDKRTSKSLFLDIQSGLPPLQLLTPMHTHTCIHITHIHTHIRWTNEPLKVCSLTFKVDSHPCSCFSMICNAFSHSLARASRPCTSLSRPCTSFSRCISIPSCARSCTCLSCNFFSFPRNSSAFSFKSASLLADAPWLFACPEFVCVVPLRCAIVCMYVCMCACIS